MGAFSNYLAYRRLRLRDAWRIANASAGMHQVVYPALRGMFIAALLIFAYNVVSARVEAGQLEADNRMAARLAKQAGYIKQLEATLANCLRRGDHPITIGDEIWFCGAANTGLKTK